MLLVAAAWALPLLALPAGEDPAAWADAAELAGLALPGSPAARVEDGTVEVAAGLVRARWAGRARELAVGPTDSAAAREDALLLGRSLLRELQAPTAPWSAWASLAPVYVAPRAFGSDGLGLELGGEARHRSLVLGLRLRAVAPRRLHDADATQWWAPLDARLSLGWRSLGPTRFGLDALAGLSARPFGEGETLVELDWKPVAGGGVALERQLGAWAVFGGLGLAADLGLTRVEGRGEAYELGLFELEARLGLARRLW